MRQDALLHVQELIQTADIDLAALDHQDQRSRFMSFKFGRIVPENRRILITF